MKKILSVTLLSAMFFTSTLAEYNFDGSTNVVGDGNIMTTNMPMSTYDTEEAFLKAEGAMCKSATDGCNTHTIVNGQLGATTLKYCEDIYGENGQEKWSCLEYKESYPSSEEFLKAEGNICSSATDGCNTHTIYKGKLGASTEKYCENIYGENGQEKWSCLKYKEPYSSSEEFLKAEGDICSSATDGCNTVTIVDGKLGGMTKMYCEDTYGENGQEKWSCLKYKEENNNTDVKICTMEYNPMCGEDGKTYGNPCTAGDNPILYKGECDSLVDTDLLKNFKKQEQRFEGIFDDITDGVLSKAIENINELIEGVRLSRIAVWGQKVKITQYVFIRELVRNELESRR